MKQLTKVIGFIHIQKSHKLKFQDVELFFQYFCLCENMWNKLICTRHEYGKFVN